MLTPKQHALLGSHLRDMQAEIDALRAAGWKIAAERDRLKASNEALIEEIDRLRESPDSAEVADTRNPSEHYRNAVVEVTRPGDKETRHSSCDCS